ncbi:hypothetical protein KSW89_10230 [Prevotella copri]|jgi:hypothetical protein|uniref:Anti sigma-E protein RseA N-terminal domain-containing protein n=1 Tax=Segatella copri TaxID=165179 RepID=A0AAW4N8I0_9BACT|nr:hypothetical protein [Segatella copri]MBU9911671.1 hypothetical protein [Segatella copri]MBV3399351.1 hypothetical protein [Segatella copri]MBV3408976.1 hypothetical protein [Segatella copri]MBV3411846.1 hypothetical protein [Segatella copri]MBV3420343.1 hypothetical protein [Segatella copri]
MNEKEKDIRLLLDRFMVGETSLEEEALIGEWFRKHPDVSDDLKEYQMMFGYFDEGMPLDHEAEEHVENAHPKAKARMRRLWLPLSLAASIALLIGFAIPWVGRQTGHRDDSKMAQFEGRTPPEDVDSAVVHEEKSTDANLSMPEKIKKSGDSVSPKTRKHKQRQYRQHLFAPASPKLWIAQNIATDSLLAEPEKLADAHLREMEIQQNEMFFKLYLVDALQTQSLNADIASASFESEENVHDEDHMSDDQEVY